MNKITENSSADRLSRLMNRNLGTDLNALKGRKKTEGPSTEQKAQASSQATSGASIKHTDLEGKIGLIPAGSYGKKPAPTLSQRARKRRRLDEARKQANVESIMALAMDYCSDSSSAEEIDPDWFHQFIQLSEDTSSKLMQALWGKILAGEIARPGTFSFKSLTILKRMTNKEAVAFQHACQLAMSNRKDGSSQIIFGSYQKPGWLSVFSLAKKQNINLSKFSLTYPQLLTLMDIELIYQTEIESGELSKGEELEYSYHGQKIRFVSKRNGTLLNYFKFTQTGSELAKLIRLMPLPSYLSELDEVFSKAFTIERG